MKMTRHNLKNTKKYSEGEQKGIGTLCNRGTNNGYRTGSRGAHVGVLYVGNAKKSKVCRVMSF